MMENQEKAREVADLITGAAHDCFVDYHRFPSTATFSNCTDVTVRIGHYDGSFTTIHLSLGESITAVFSRKA